MTKSKYIAVKRKISSDIEALNELNKVYNWIPNEYQIRPRDDILLKKQETLYNIHIEWSSVKAFIKHSVWGLDKITNEEGLFHVLEEPSHPHIFVQCDFPYNLMEHSNHFVLWFNEIECTRNDEDINMLLDEYIAKTFNYASINNNYSFAWYVNPKMSVPDYFHVQVFAYHHHIHK